MKPLVTAWIAITFADGTLGRMQLFAEPTSENILAAINKTAWQSPPVRWRRVQKTDFPASNIDRNAWVDNGKTIAVDLDRKATLDRAKPRDVAAELDALNLKVTQLGEKVAVADPMLTGGTDVKPADKP